jgi:hypothetical protein
MSSHSRKSWSLLLVIGLALLAERAHAQRCGEGQLSLSTTGSLMLPATFGIQGVDAAQDGRLTLWSTSGELLLVDAARKLTTYQLPDTIVPVGVVPDGVNGFRLIDTQKGREMLAHTDGSVQLVGDLPLQSGEQVQQAVRWDDGWILGTIDFATKQYLIRYIRGGASETWFRSTAADSVTHILRYTIGAGASGVLLTLGSAPFTVQRFDRIAKQFRPLPAPLANEPSLIPADSLKNWRAVSTVALDCTLVLTLSDLSSDQRLLVRYGADDRVERTTRVDAPLGLVTRIPGSRTVLAARRAGELELVWYDWRWVREPGSAGH